jgi:hypothetical protein
MADYTASVWFERDRAMVALLDNDKEVFCLWDDDVYGAIQDGFLPKPRHPRPSEAEWLPCLIEYANYYGLI